MVQLTGELSEGDKNTREQLIMGGDRLTRFTGSAVCITHHDDIYLHDVHMVIT